MRGLLGAFVMMFVGIDPSLNGTGVAFIDNSKLIASRTLSNNKMVGINRLINIRDQLLGELSCRNAGHVCIEGYSLGSKNSRKHAAGEWGGVLRVALQEAGYEIWECPPKTLKKFATGNGNIAGKEPMVRALKRDIGANLAHAEDECDAAWCALILERRYGKGRLTLPKDRHDCVYKIACLTAKPPRLR